MIEKIENNFYKYAFYSVLLILITLTVYYTQRSKSNSNNFNFNQRYNSLLLSQSINGRNISNQIGISFKGKNKERVDFTKPTIIILLSNFGCSQCQKREIDLIKNFIKKYRINVFGFYKTEDESSILRLDRAFDITFRLCSIENEIFSDLSCINKYPQVFFIEKNKIISSLFPIIGDNQFSEIFYNNIASVIEHYAKGI